MSDFWRRALCVIDHVYWGISVRATQSNLWPHPNCLSWSQARRPAQIVLDSSKRTGGRAEIELMRSTTLSSEGVR
jgi:hypothetical protein